MGLNFTSYVPTVLNGVNSPSQTLAAEVVTGMPISTGALPGARFYMTEQQANQLSNNLCHEGWYRVVQVDSGATPGYINFGYIGAQLSLTKGQDVVTSADKSLAAGIAPCIFLGTVTPGNYTIVQDQGDATVMQSAGSVTLGNILSYTTAQNGEAGTAGTTFVTGTVGVAEAAATVAGLIRVRLGFPFGQLAD